MTNVKIGEMGGVKIGGFINLQLKEFKLKLFFLFLKVFLRHFRYTCGQKHNDV